MTRALDAAVKKLAELPTEEQERVGQWLLEELRDEDLWTRKFRVSQDALKQLASEALANHAAGRTTPLDPDKL
jgi:hypothetical protein